MSYLGRLFPPPQEQRRKQAECEQVQRDLRVLVERLERAVDRLAQNHL